MSATEQRPLKVLTTDHRAQVANFNQACREHGVEYGFMVFAGHNRDVFIGLFAKIGKIMERGKYR